MSSFKPFANEQKRDKRVIELEKDEDGRSIITEAYLKQLCEKNGQYS